MKILKVIRKDFIRKLSEIFERLKALEYESYRRDKYLADARDKARIQYFNFGRGGFL